MTKEEVFDYMIENKISHLYLDTWGSKHRADMFKAMEIGVTSKIEYKGFTFFKQFKKGGGAGMGAYPDTFDIFILYCFEKELKN